MYSKGLDHGWRPGEMQRIEKKKNTTLNDDEDRVIKNKKL
jgi:hypothetical protein